ncbi:MAG: tRNA (adenine(22)-N(1))-methyltransferase [Pseudoalteromonas sp.]
MKLSHRLSAINSLVDESYDVIWDCCCDHGLLGMTLLKREVAHKVVFVDIVPELMDALSNTLARFADSNANSQWQVQCKDVSSIELTADAKQLIIIAGVGGELLLRLMQKIIENHDQQTLNQLSFIICPVHHTYALRKGLAQLGLGLKSEQIIIENKRFYELLHVSFKSNIPIEPTGCSMWDFTDKHHQQYVKTLIAHYTRMTKKEPTYYEQVIADYKQLNLVKTNRAV